MRKKTAVHAFKAGAKIKWKWLGRDICGEVVEIYFQPTAKVIKEKTIKRNASTENPAYLVQSLAGNLALKLHSELQIDETEKSEAHKPRMFSAR